MKEATLSLNLDILGQTAAGVVFAGLTLQIDQTPLPSARWSDSVVIVLGWWCRALARVLAGERAPVEVMFMEGPYAVNIGPRNGAALHLEWVERRAARSIRNEYDVQASKLVESVLAAAQRIRIECEARGWWSSDADELVSALEALRAESRRLN